jgi:hypothetical protein
METLSSTVLLCTLYFLHTIYKIGNILEPNEKTKKNFLMILRDVNDLARIPTIFIPIVILLWHKIIYEEISECNVK